MKSGGAKALRLTSRSHKRIQRLPISNALRDALETEIWFRLNQPQLKDADIQDIFEEAVAWFLKHQPTPSGFSYENIDSHWPSVSFWLDTRLLDRCRSRALRDGISKRRVLGTALSLYCHQFIPASFKTFRHKTARQAMRLYAQHRSRVLAKNSPRKRPS